MSKLKEFIEQTFGKKICFNSMSIPQFDEYSKMHGDFILKKCTTCDALGKRTENIYKKIDNKVKSLTQITVPKTIEQVKKNITESLVPKFNEMNALYKGKCPNSKDYNIENILPNISEKISHIDDTKKLIL